MLDSQPVRNDKRHVARLAEVVVRRQDVIAFWALVAAFVMSIAVFAVIVILVFL